VSAPQDHRGGGPLPRIVRTPTPEPLFGSLFSLESWTSPWRSRRLIRSLAMRRLQERFRGSWLGAVWVFLLPVLMLAVYSFAFIVVFQVGGADGEQRVERVFAIFCGMIVFGLFNETVQRSATSIVSHPQFVKKVVFPLDALPAVSLGENLALAGASLTILLCGTLLVLGRAHPTWLLLPLPLVALAMLALGVGWLLATVGVFVRDLAQALGVVMQMLFFLTPVCYTLQDVPASMRDVAALNPLVPIIEMARGLVLHGSLPDAGTVLTTLVVGALAMQIGHAVFTARHRRFADVL
jgi:lipopolysaccharide transport system permease protein